MKDTVKLQVPDGCSGISLDGDELIPDAGVIEVAADKVAALAAFGCKPYVPTPKKAKGSDRGDAI